MDAQRQAELREVARKLVAGTLWPEPMTAYLVALDFCRDREEGQFLRGVIASLKAASAQQEETMAAETSPPSTSSTTPSPATEKPFESLRRPKSEGRMACATLLLEEVDKELSRSSGEPGSHSN